MLSFILIPVYLLPVSSCVKCQTKTVPKKPVETAWWKIKRALDISATILGAETIGVIIESMESFVQGQECLAGKFKKSKSGGWHF